MNKETKTVKVQEFINNIIENEIGNPESEYKKRLNVFRAHCFDFTGDYLKFTIMGDALMCFYKTTPELEKEWLEGDYTTKVKVLSKLINDLEPEKFMGRVMYFNNVLLYTHAVKRDPFYLYVANRLFYLVSGDEGFLTDIGICLYNLPPEPEPPEEIEVPQKPHEGMYQ